MKYYASDVLRIRRTTGLNQKDFWQLFGATQSGGSRYENGRRIPNPTKILLKLIESNSITFAQLKDITKLKKSKSKASKK